MSNLSHSHDEVMLAGISSLLLSVARIERALQAERKGAATSTSASDAVLREQLTRLTVKRHAVLTATLGGVGYQELATIMGCDTTTVKLHLKAALHTLGIQSREVLLISHKNRLASIADAEYESLYGVPKRWWLEQKPALMAVLRTTKPSHNQHTKSRA